MVQILREQTRNYAADQSGAIRQAQLAQNVQEWGSVLQSTGNLAINAVKQTISDRETTEKLQAKAREKQLKLQQEADTNMINTKIGGDAENAVLWWASNEIQNGVDPNTDDFIQKLYAKKDEVYKPYIDQMTSEKGKLFLEAQGKKVVDNIVKSNIGKIAQNRQKAQAKAAFIGTANNLENEAKEFGKIGDWNAFKEATADERKALNKYAKANGIPELSLAVGNIVSFELGQAETNPELILNTYGTKDELREIRREDVGELIHEEAEKKRPFTMKMVEALDKGVLTPLGKVRDEAIEQGVLSKLFSKKERPLSKEEKDELFDKWYEQANIKQDSVQRRLEMLPEEAVEQVRTAFVASKKGEIEEIKKEIRQFPKESKTYKVLEDKIGTIQEQIDNPDEYVADMLTQEIKKAVYPKAKEQFELNKLQAKEADERYAKDFYHILLNPNSEVSFPAIMAFNLGDRPSVEKLFNMSIPDAEMNRVTEAYIKNKMDVIQKTTTDIVATKGLAEKIEELLSYTNENPIAVTKTYMEGLTELHNSGITQKQYDEALAILDRGFDDKVFGQATSRILNNMNRWYPDMPRAMYGTLNFVPPEYMSQIGLPSSNLNMLDEDSVRNFMTTRKQEIKENLMAKIANASRLQTQEERVTALNEIGGWLETEKQKMIDTALTNYGLDVAQLRENKRKYGRAFTQITSNLVHEYMGDKDDGTPWLQPVYDLKAQAAAQKRVLGELESSMKQTTEKAE